MGRNPIGEEVMSAAERQRRRRQHLKEGGIVTTLVNKDLIDDYFSVSKRIADAVINLYTSGIIDDKLLSEITEEAINTPSPRSLIDAKFIRKKISEAFFVKEENDEKQ